ncbi:MAG: M14-type cytosolic carboxypeptidase [Thermoguttaceae bacterium]|nr:M14-type cytosolic carboxypeptidase [Thermoguttaceae bacterium]MDW8077929.1 M14-type cytosolic carboxypeptidase [Thermoguttaceae bacterium]
MRGLFPPGLMRKTLPVGQQFQIAPYRVVFTLWMAIRILLPESAWAGGFDPVAPAVRAESIRVSADFEGGNVCAVDIRPAETAAEIRFAADPRGGTEALWFNFKLHAPRGTQLRLILTNPDTLLGGGGDWNTVHPAVRFSESPERMGPWRRVTGAHMHRLPDGRMEVAWTLLAESEYLQFAFCYPYGTHELCDTVETCRGYWKVDQIGVSSRGRPILRLSNSYGDLSRQVLGVLLTARQHSGETPGSWVLDGLLRDAVDEISPEKLVLWVIPFANVDGVIEGEYGKDPHPIDLNRDWTSPMPMRYETSVIQKDIERLRQRSRLVAAVDFHAPGAREAAGAYFQVLKPQDPQAAAIRQFVDKLMPYLPAELMAKDAFRIATYGSRWNERGTLGSYLWDRYHNLLLRLKCPTLALGRESSKLTITAGWGLH